MSTNGVFSNYLHYDATENRATETVIEGCYFYNGHAYTTNIPDETAYRVRGTLTSYGSNGLDVRIREVNYDNVNNKFKTESPNHAEARGIQALISKGIAVKDARQSTTLLSCEDCTNLQTDLKIDNLTGIVKSKK